jgi:ribosomal protein S18 acetylase RimI-like enzyme
MGVKTIRAGLEHLDVLTGLFDAYRQFYGQESDLPGARRFLEARLRNRESVVLLAVQDAALESGVGFVQLYPSFSSVSMKPIWILNDLFVAPQARRAGIAQTLLEAACEMARSTGATRLRLSTAKDNEAAKALYLASGYRMVEFDQYELDVLQARTFTARL